MLPSIYLIMRIQGYVCAVRRRFYNQERIRSKIKRCKRRKLEKKRKPLQIFTVIFWIGLKAFEVIPVFRAYFISCGKKDFL